MPNEIFYLSFLDRCISNRRGVWLVLLLPCFIEIPVFNANGLDPASDLGLDRLPFMGKPGINGLKVTSFILIVLWSAYDKSKNIPGCALVQRIISFLHIY